MGQGAFLEERIHGLHGFLGGGLSRFGRKTEAGGGQSTQVALTFGTKFSQGRGRFFGTVETLYREAIFLRDRDFSSTSNLASKVPAPFNTLGGPFDARTARGRYPIFLNGPRTLRLGDIALIYRHPCGYDR